MTAPVVLRQVSFYPPVGGGKYHAVSRLDGDEIATCRAMILDRAIPPIMLTPLSDRVPAMICRRCLKIVEGEE